MGSYVDLAWPWGLFTLGVQPLLSPAPDQGWIDRRTFVTAAYTFAGLRMGLGAVALLLKGHLKEEMPRYLYQRLRWAKKGVTEEGSWRFCLEMQKEIFVQVKHFCKYTCAIDLSSYSDDVITSPLIIWLSRARDLPTANL